MDNAIKYSLAKGAIEISSSISKNKVEITVRDYGKGIDEKDIPYIFNRFYRADKSRSQHGYGLGLSIAKKIIDAHHGALWVKSIPQKTTEFTVALPKSQKE